MEYKLKSVSYKDTTIEKTDEYTDYVREPNIPEEKDFDVNGKKIKGTLVDVTKKISDTYNVPFSVPARFYGSPDVEVYILNGKEISAANAPKFSNYPGELLTYLNLDGNIYNIQNGSWNGGYYTDNNGQTVRNAIFTGMQRSNSYIAKYDLASYTANAVYEIAGKTTNAKIKVFYEAEKPSYLKPILIGSGLALLLLAISIILFYLKKRRAENEER